MISIVLASSPLVGHGAMAGVAEELRHSDRVVCVPHVPIDPASFTESVATSIRESIRESITDSDERAVVVGFSAAGPRLFEVASAARPAALVFLDARLPADGIAPDAESRFAELLDSLPLAPDGTLPAWPDWWPPELLATLIPDPDVRNAFARACPRPLRSVFAHPIPAPSYDGPCGFVGFGDGYAADAAEAARRGWPVCVLPGAHHLWPVVAPVAVAAAIVEMIDRLGA